MTKRKYVHRLIEKELMAGARDFPALVLTGPRQTGKTTLLRTLFSSFNYISFDDPLSRGMAERDPELFLDNIGTPSIIDEIQYVPGLLPYIKMRVDAHRGKCGQYFLTGSQVFPMMSGLTETLAGRVALYELLGLSFDEIKSRTPRSSKQVFEFMVNGFFPDTLIHKVSRDRFYPSYVSTYIERDVRHIQNVHDLSLFRDFLEILAARVGALLNISEISRDCGISVMTARRWLSVLSNSRIIYLLRPYHKNISKRTMKSPKLYFLDTGLLAYILRYRSGEQIETGPLSGNFFENMIVSEILKAKFNRNHGFEMYFFRDSNQNEIDLVLESAMKTTLIEVKCAKTPRYEHVKTLEKHSCLFKNPKSFLLCLAEKPLPLTKNISVVNWADIYEILGQHDIS
jgi:predicted AAA+ superfamily ATPase